MTDFLLQPCAATAELCLPPRLAWGARAIAEYLGKGERWLRKQIERAKRPPPTFRIGSAVVADLDALDRWIEQHKAKGARKWQI